jgi:hypothetical protein
MGMPEIQLAVSHCDLLLRASRFRIRQIPARDAIRRHEGRRQGAIQPLPAKLHLTPEQQRVRRNEAARRYRARHREKHLASLRAYKKRNRAKIAAYNKAYDAAMPSEQRARRNKKSLEWSKNNPERKRATARADYQRMLASPQRRTKRENYLKEYYLREDVHERARTRSQDSAFREAERERSRKRNAALRADPERWAAFLAYTRKYRKIVRERQRLLTPAVAASIMAQLDAFVSRGTHPDIRRDLINELYMELADGKTTLAKLQAPKSKDYARVRGRISELLGRGRLSLDNEIPGGGGLTFKDTIAADQPHC